LELMLDRALKLQSRPAELERIIGLAQRHLGVDVVFVSETNGDRQVCRAVAGDGLAFGVAANRPMSERGLAERLVTGEIANVVRDTGADARLLQVPGLREADVGSFVGVPLRLADATLYGTLCCLCRRPNPGLGDRDVRFMTMLGELVMRDLGHGWAQQQLRADLTTLITTENVDVAYQPIFDLRTNRCLGIEALARFPEPFTRPDLTFAAAHSVGLGLELEELIVRRAWSLLPRLAKDQYLALNLTPESLFALARRAHDRDEVPLSSLVIEITEHVAIDAYAELRGELEQLRERGLRVAVDDAGAGYASLRHVIELKPDIVKIDRSLIHGLAEDCARRVAVSAFVSVARDLGSTVVAEGVELRADRDAVRALGVHAAQGYLLGRPSTDPAYVTQWIGRGRHLGVA
jgi:EAL domain-containing protein (putative c-di-GMP-specific phosphodiesterase class I)